MKNELICPDDCEYKIFDYWNEFCTLHMGIEEDLEKTDSGKFKRTEFCKRIKFLEDKEE
jgi:hypothetical protein